MRTYRNVNLWVILNICFGESIVMHKVRLTQLKMLLGDMLSSAKKHIEDGSLDI